MTPPCPIAGAVLAAGSGTRLGTPKADLVVDGTRLLDRAVAALRGGGCDPVLAVVRAGTPVSGARPVVNPDPSRGQRSSLALAVDAAWAPDADAHAGADARAGAGEPVALAVLLVDQPDVGASSVVAVIRAWRPGRIVAGSYAGRRGHPIVMSLADWQLALSLAGPDEGARALLATRADRLDEVSVTGDPDDLDTPADLARWQTRRVEAASRLSPAVGRPAPPRPGCPTIGCDRGEPTSCGGSRG